MDVDVGLDDPQSTSSTFNLLTFDKIITIIRRRTKQKHPAIELNKNNSMAGIWREVFWWRVVVDHLDKKLRARLRFFFCQL